jgi:hypothetical protein
VRWRADQPEDWSSSAATFTRPAIANERLKSNCRQVVLQLKSPYKDGTIYIVMEPLEFLAHRLR